MRGAPVEMCLKCRPQSALNAPSTLGGQQVCEGRCCSNSVGSEDSSKSTAAEPAQGTRTSRASAKVPRSPGLLVDVSFSSEEKSPKNVEHMCVLMCTVYLVETRYDKHRTQGVAHVVRHENIKIISS